MSGSPAADDFKERWPALFCETEIEEEFRRITTISLEQSFMYKFDHYTPKRIALMKAKGGVVGTKLSQNQSIEMRLEAIIHSLILYLGEKEEELFEDCAEDNLSDAFSRSWSSIVLMERIQWMYPSFLKARRCCQNEAVLLKLARCLWG